MMSSFDLTPGLDSLSLKLAEATLGSPPLLKALAKKAVDAKQDKETLQASICRQVLKSISQIGNTNKSFASADATKEPASCSSTDCAANVAAEFEKEFFERIPDNLKNVDIDECGVKEELGGQGRNVASDNSNVKEETGHRAGAAREEVFSGYESFPSSEEDLERSEKMAKQDEVAPAILQVALELFIEKSRLAKCQDDNDSSSRSREFLTLYYLSGEEQRIPVFRGMTVEDVQNELGRMKNMPGHLFSLIPFAADDAVPCKRTDLVEEALKDSVLASPRGVADTVISPYAATVCVLSLDLKVGDLIWGHWSAGTTDNAKPFSEARYPGVILSVNSVENAEKDGSEMFYGIRWEDDNARSINVHREGSVWRTGFGGIIMAIERRQPGEWDGKRINKCDGS